MKEPIPELYLNDNVLRLELRIKSRQTIRGIFKKDLSPLELCSKETIAELKKQFADFGLKGSWYGTTRRRYGGKYALVSRYDRVGLSGDVHVEDYRFFLNNYIVEITLSYRKSEFDHWNSDFTRIPLTLKFY